MKHKDLHAIFRTVTAKTVKARLVLLLFGCKYQIKYISLVLLTSIACNLAYIIDII